MSGYNLNSEFVVQTGVTVPVKVVVFTIVIESHVITVVATSYSSLVG